jgi:serine/threonine protein kinase
MPRWAKELAQLCLSDGLMRPGLDLASFGKLIPLDDVQSNVGGCRHYVYRGELADGSLRVLKEYPAADYVTLMREARLLRRLRHPYIAEVGPAASAYPECHTRRRAPRRAQVDAVVWSSDRLKVYLVLQFCEGGTLASAMRSMTLSQELRCKALMRQVVTRSHARGGG